MNKIYLIEDNEKLQKYICEYMKAYDYEVKIVEDYDNIIDEINTYEPQIIILDINLPKYDGYYYLGLIRKQKNIPIIILSARSDESEQIRGMNLGADDYMTKPFSIGILLAKINALLRRSTVIEKEFDVVEYKHVRLNLGTMNVSYNNKTLEMTGNESKLLKTLLLQGGNVVTREQLLEELWDDKNFVDDNTLTVNITRLKKKLIELGLKDAIGAKRGVGYVFDITI
ncbi:MAG: response regulator transcription factor [Cellulosilyticaceae bacterium]